MFQVLLVDDEPLILAGLKKKVDWASLGFCVAATAGDSDQALRRARRVRPDLVLMDVRIPTIDGLELMRLLQQEMPCRFIVVSGFSDFEYARQALRLGALDYLLKPVSAQALEKALRAARAALLERVPGRSEFFRLFALLQNARGNETDAPFLRELHLEKRFPLWRCCYTAARKLRFAPGREWPARCLFRDGGSFCWLVNFSAGDDLPGALEEAVSPSQAGLSPPFSSLAELPRAAARAEACYNCRFYDSRVLLDACADDFSPLAELLAQLRGARQKQLPGVCVQLLQKVPRILARRRLSFDCFERFYRAAQALAAPAGAPPEERASREELLNGGIAQAMDRLAALFREPLDAQGRGNARQIAEKIRARVDADYGAELSLAQFAEEYYLDKNYLSHIFKEEVGENFSAYVNRVRLAHACTMLRETQVRTEAVAALCGYHDFSYFAKVFKKTMGVTPTQYRERPDAARRGDGEGGQP